MDREDPLSGVSKTALGMALIRAGESRRSDRLFSDPYAQEFANAVPGAFSREEAIAAQDPSTASFGAAFADHGVLRTRFFDDFLLAAAGSGCRQVVLLAAGLDSRAFRLSWPDGTRLFELDLPEILEFKEPVLARLGSRPACERLVIPADLRGDWPSLLAQTSFDPKAPTAWLIEGLLLYLAADEAARLLINVGELSAPGSQISFEHVSEGSDAVLAQVAALPGMSQYAALWKGGLGSSAPDWLAANGWRPELRGAAEFAASCGRPVQGEPGGFLTAVRL